MTKGSLKKKDKCQLRSAALSPKKYIGLPALGTTRSERSIKFAFIYGPKLLCSYVLTVKVNV